MILAESTKVGLKVQLSGEEMCPLVVISKTHNESNKRNRGTHCYFVEKHIVLLLIYLII